jgi:hypothetical protein
MVIYMAIKKLDKWWHWKHKWGQFLWSTKLSQLWSEEWFYDFPWNATLIGSQYQEQWSYVYKYIFLSSIKWKQNKIILFLFFFITEFYSYTTIRKAQQHGVLSYTFLLTSKMYAVVFLQFLLNVLFHQKFVLPFSLTDCT